MTRTTNWELVRSMDRRAVVHALFFEAIFQLKNNNQIDRVLD